MCYVCIFINLLNKFFSQHNISDIKCLFCQYDKKKIQTKTQIIKESKLKFLNWIIKLSLSAHSQLEIFNTFFPLFDSCISHTLNISIYNIHLCFLYILKFRNCQLVSILK